MISVTTLALSLMLSACTLGGDRVTPGEPVPPLTGVRWLDGAAFDGFSPGRICVIEFWSTWCGGCVASIEHLNKLAAQHRDDAIFVALHIWPRESAPKPTEFIVQRRLRGQPVWNFAIGEDVDDAIVNSWIEPTAVGGLPTAMIVDDKQRLVWIGHTKDLAAPLQEVIDRTYDVSAGVENINRRIRASKLADESSQAIQDGSYERGIDRILDAYRVDPHTVSDWLPSTYGQLLAASKSPVVAARFIERLQRTTPIASRDVFAGIAYMILRSSADEPRDLPLALTCAEFATEAESNPDPDVLHTLALVRAELEDYDGAIDALDRALATASGDERNSLLEYRAGLADKRRDSHTP